MVRPRVLFSSVSTTWDDAPGAVDLAFLFTRLNSSVSARTRFMCCHTVSLCVFAEQGRLSSVYLIKCKHLAGHGTSVVQGDAHTPVDLDMISQSGLVMEEILTASRHRGSREEHVHNRPNLK